MSESEFECALQALLLEAESTGDMPDLKAVHTFEESGVMTRNRGLVVTLADGTQYQLTINRAM
jgi:hypothetical protein